MRRPGPFFPGRKSNRRRWNDNSVRMGWRGFVVVWGKSKLTHMARPPQIRVTVAIFTSDYRTYVRAARILSRVMGHTAPTVEALIRFQLMGRDTTGVADDYLDSTGWPLERARIIPLRQPRSKPRRRSFLAPTAKQSRKADAGPAGEPSRN